MSVDLQRGRSSRADLVMALMRDAPYVLTDVERGGAVVLRRLDLVEALLRDPFWDDIDASVEEPAGTVTAVLAGDPSPSVLLADGRVVSLRLARRP